MRFRWAGHKGRRAGVGDMCDSPGAVGWEGGPERREMGELMTTQEVADYLRLKERKIYELVRQKRIPCTRVTGKWLFPKAEIDQWLGRSEERRVGKEGGGTCRSRGSPEHKKK